MSAVALIDSPAADLEVQIARFADIVGMMKPSAAQRRDGQIGTIPLGDYFAELNMGTIAAIGDGPRSPLRQTVVVDCPGIPDAKGVRQPCATSARYECIAFFGNRTVCQDCRDKYDEATDAEEKRVKWEAICPKSFLDTDRTHAGFPRAQYEQTKDWKGESSLFFHGPTGAGKSRLAVMLLKRSARLNKSIGILWPEDLRTLVTGYDQSTFDGYAVVPVLLIDDPLLTACRESKLVDALKNLVDKRMRRERVTIFTSQIGTEQELTEGKEFKEAKTADVERIKALLRRLKESCRVISFASAKAGEGEAEF